MTPWSDEDFEDEDYEPLDENPTMQNEPDFEYFNVHFSYSRFQI
jgi:hypothetical protein